ncbi:MAG: hypothetical protein U0271_36395 [Polyangiaceae bacterium]
MASALAACGSSRAEHGAHPQTHEPPPVDSAARSEPTTPAPRPEPVVLGAFERERLADVDRVVGFGVFAGAVVAVADTFEEALLFNRDATGWTRRKLGSRTVDAIAAGTDQLALVRHATDGSSEVELLSTDGTYRSAGFLSSSGEVHLARGGGVLIAAYRGKNPGEVLVVRRSETSDQPFEALGTLRLQAGFALTVDGSGVAHVVGRSVDATGLVHAVLSPGHIEEIAADRTLEGLDLAVCAGTPHAVLLRPDRTVALARWGASAWEDIGPAIRGPLGLGQLLFDPSCRALLLADGAIWAHGPTGWKRAGDPNIGHDAATAIADDERVYIAHRRARDGGGGFEVWIASAPIQR